jgi:hypothetical protein
METLLIVLLVLFCSAAVVGGIPVGAGTSVFSIPAGESKSPLPAFGHGTEYLCGQPGCKPYMR